MGYNTIKVTSADMRLCYCEPVVVRHRTDLRVNRELKALSGIFTPKIREMPITIMVWIAHNIYRRGKYRKKALIVNNEKEL